MTPSYPLYVAGPSTFVAALKTEKPAEDRKTFDARRLTLHQAAQNAVHLPALVVHHCFIAVYLLQ